MGGDDFYLDTSGCQALEVLDKGPVDLFGILVGYQSDGDLGVRLGREDRLGTFARVSAPDTVYVERRADGGALAGVVALFAVYLRYAHVGFVALHVERQGVHLLAFLRGNFLYVVVEMRDGDPSCLVVQGGDHFAQCRAGIDHRSAEMSRMQVARGAFDRYLEIRKPAQAGHHRGLILARHRGVGNQYHVAGQLPGMVAHESVQVGRTGFLFAFDQEFDVAGQGAAAHHVFEGQHVHVHLSLVVVGSPGQDRPFGVQVGLSDDGVEGRVLPQFQRLDRLYVVVSVHQHGRQGGVEYLFGHYGRMTAGFHHAGPVGTRGQKFGHQGIRHAAHVVPVGAYRGYGGDAQQGEEFVEHTLFFVFDVVLQVFACDFFHRSVRFFRVRNVFRSADRGGGFCIWN